MYSNYFLWTSAGVCSLDVAMLTQTCRHFCRSGHVLLLRKHFLTVPSHPHHLNSRLGLSLPPPPLGYHLLLHRRCGGCSLLPSPQGQTEAGSPPPSERRLPAGMPKINDAPLIMLQLCLLIHIEVKNAFSFKSKMANAQCLQCVCLTEIVVTFYRLTVIETISQVSSDSFQKEGTQCIQALF